MRSWAIKSSSHEAINGALSLYRAVMVWFYRRPMKRTKLALKRETLRRLGVQDLALARGAMMGTNDGNSCTAATDGQGNCQSELSDCPTHMWSCINVSCTVATQGTE